MFLAIICNDTSWPCGPEGVIRIEFQYSERRGGDLRTFFYQKAFNPQERAWRRVSRWGCTDGTGTFEVPEAMRCEHLEEVREELKGRGEVYNLAPTGNADWYAPVEVVPCPRDTPGAQKIPIPWRCLLWKDVPSEEDRAELLGHSILNPGRAPGAPNRATYSCLEIDVDGKAYRWQGQSARGATYHTAETWLENEPDGISNYPPDFVEWNGGIDGMSPSSCYIYCKKGN